MFAHPSPRTRRRERRLCLLWIGCRQVRLAFGRFDTRRSVALDARELHAALQRPRRPRRRGRSGAAAR